MGIISSLVTTIQYVRLRWLVAHGNEENVAGPQAAVGLVSIVQAGERRRDLVGDVQAVEEGEPEHAWVGRNYLMGGGWR